MGRYIKYNKAVGEQLKNDLISVETELKDLLNAIQSYCNAKRSLSADQVYKNTNLWEDMGEGLTRFFTGDYNNAYNSFKSNLLDVYNKTTEKENGELSNLTSLKNAVVGLDKLINEFDVATAFSLSDSYESDNNITIKGGSDGTSVIYYIDADGKEVSLATLTNAFYTETGMTMDAMLKGYLTAEENGVAFDAKYQQNIYDAVGATVGDIQAAGGFGVASEQDIIAVDEYLKEDINYKSYLAYDAEGKLARDTGATNANNMAVGADALNAYAMTDYINGNPFDGGKSSGGETVPGGESYGPSYPQGDGGGVYDDGSTSGGPTERPYEGTETPTEETGIETPPEETGTEDTGSETPTDETNEFVGETGLTQEEADTISSEIDTITGDEDHKNIELDLTDDYDAMARDKYETMNPEEMAERRGNIISEAEELFANEDKSVLRSKLKEYGYDDRDIEKIIQSEDATISAMMEGDQRMTMSEYAKEFAEKDGVEDFDSKYDDAQDYRNYNEDSSSHIIANRNNDPEVKEAREEYLGAKEEYKEAASDVNTSINNVNDSKDEIEKFKEEKGSDVSKWTKDDVKDYREKVDDYNKNVEDMNNKKDVLAEKEENYNEAKENYDKAKDNFDKRIRGENVEDTKDLKEREQEESAVEVNVDNEELLPGTENTSNESNSGDLGTKEIEHYASEEKGSSPVEVVKSEEAAPKLASTDGAGAPVEESTANNGETPKTNESEAVVMEDGTVVTEEAPIVKEDGTVGMVVTEDSGTESVEMNQNDLLGMATETVDSSQLADAAPVSAAEAEPSFAAEATAEPSFTSEATAEPSFNATKPQEQAKSLEGETAQDIEKEIIDNLVVTDDSISFAKPSGTESVADNVTEVGNGQSEVSVENAALLNMLEQTDAEGKKEE